jgi:hypothetical protein
VLHHYFLLDEEGDFEVEWKMEGILGAEADVNIWDEEETSDTLVLSDEPNGSTGPKLKAATFNQLVTQLCTTKSKDSAFKAVFFGSLSSFTTPEKLMKKLIQRYRCPTVPASIQGS